MIPNLKDILPTHILEDAGRPNIHKSGSVWAHKGSEGKYGAEYKGKIEYFHDIDRARAFAKTGSGYSGGISNTDNISDKDIEKVINIRDYTDDEYDEETGEYFENDDAMKAAPNAFTDKDDMIRQMKTAKPKFLSLNSMRNMNNSDVGDILKAGDKMKIIDYE